MNVGVWYDVHWRVGSVIEQTSVDFVVGCICCKYTWRAHFQNHFGIIINWQRKAVVDYYTVVSKKRIRERERICSFSCHFHESRCCKEPRDSFLLLYLVLAATCAILSSLCNHLHKYVRMRYRNTFAYAWDTICMRVDFWFATPPFRPPPLPSVLCCSDGEHTVYVQDAFCNKVKLY